VQQKTTTWPVISTAQNGSGVAAQMLEYFDTYGNLIWKMDERGFITGGRNPISPPRSGVRFERKDPFEVT
jgi:hypothetical protein